MAFKITKKTRIKIDESTLRNAQRVSGCESYYEFVFSFPREAGLKRTSKRYNRFKTRIIYYYQVEDKAKYMLAKIKYGI